MSPVIFVMIDGLRPDAISVEYAPNLTQLLSRSAYTLQARSVMPSITLPCHTSIFHSIPPTRHGITSNDWQPMARPVPGLVEVAHAQGRACAFFYNWEPLRNLSQPGNLDFAYFRAGADINPQLDQTIAEQAVAYFMADQPDFMFVYLGTVDEAGHAHGWMSAGYLAQLKVADAALATLLAALPDDATILLQSDHGGHDRSHGTEMAEDMTIPWLVAGPGVRRGHQLNAPVSLLDTAPTLAHFLKLKIPSVWEGRFVAEILE